MSLQGARALLAGRLRASLLAAWVLAAGGELPHGYDCDTHWLRLETGWSVGKERWCCQHAGIGCSPSSTEAFYWNCDLFFDNWEQSWTNAKKKYCCRRRGRACLAYDCEQRANNQWRDWLQAKRDWCCSEEGSCGDTAPKEKLHDCEADADTWEQSWPEDKREFCCRTTGKACQQWDCSKDIATWQSSWNRHKQQWCCARSARFCETTTSEGDFDCGAFAVHWEAQWSDAKKEHCCRTTGKACTKFDCHSQLPTWRTSWNEAKKEFCCQTESIGCTTTPFHPVFDCNAGYQNWRKGWSERKKAFCCKEANRGCGGSTSTPQFDCEVNFPTWETSWTTEEQVWCCQTAGRACEPYDCRQGRKDKWIQLKRQYCLENPVATTSLLLDAGGATRFHNCRYQEDIWESWPQEKKDYCCAQGWKGCKKYECGKDHLGGEQQWSPDRRQWCCREVGLGCFVMTGPETQMKEASARVYSRPAPAAIALTWPLDLLVAAIAAGLCLTLPFWRSAHRQAGAGDSYQSVGQSAGAGTPQESSPRNVSGDAERP